MFLGLNIAEVDAFTADYSLLPLTSAAVTIARILVSYLALRILRVKI